MVTEFLKFARPLDLSTEEIPLRSLVDRAITEIREAIPDVAISSAGELENIAGDEGLLRQALLNLIRNAAEAAAGQAFGGRVEVYGAIEHAGSGDLQRISITDNGPGVAPDDLLEDFRALLHHQNEWHGAGPRHRAKDCGATRGIGRSSESNPREALNSSFGCHLADRARPRAGRLIPFLAGN